MLYEGDELLNNTMLYGVSIMVIIFVLFYNMGMFVFGTDCPDVHTDFYPDMDKLYDMPKLWGFAEESYYESLDNKIDGQVQVIIDVKASGLTKQELSIVKGIILINGHRYYEI